jgi:hypothetical protein
LKNWLYILLFLSAFAAAAFEITGDGSPVDFTKVGFSARFWGMGRAGVALADDSGALLLNPASMAMANSFEFSGTNTRILGVTNYSLLNGVLPLYDGRLLLGFSLIYENAGTIYETNGLDQYGHPRKGGTIENNNVVASLGFGSKFSVLNSSAENLYLGLLLKNHRRVLGDLTSSGTALDLGGMYRCGDHISLGLAMRNVLQSGLSYSTADQSSTEHYDTEYATGLAFSLLNNDLTLSVDRTFSDKYGRNNIGLEYWLANMVALRSGLAEKDMTLGIGLRYASLQLDVGYRYQDAPLENQFYFSLTYGDAHRIFLTAPEIEIIENPPEEKSPPPVQTPVQNIPVEQSGRSYYNNGKDRPEEIRL